MTKYANIVYCDVNLEQYCVQNNISYKYIRYKLNCYKDKKERFLPIDIQIQLAIQKYKKKRKYTDLNYKGLRLVDYCNSNNIEYQKIADRCKYFLGKNNDISLLTEEQISLFIEDYYRRKKIQDLRGLFARVDVCSKEEYKKICKELNINYEKIKKLTYHNNLDIKSLIYICWYSSDKNNSKGIYISQSRLNKLLISENLELNDLYGMYKSGNETYLERIFEHEKFYLIGFVLRIVREYNFKVYGTDYEDLFSEAKIILIKCISRNVYSNVARIIRYIEKSVTMQILDYLIKNYSNKNLLYDDTRRDKNTLNKRLEY